MFGCARREVPLAFLLVRGTRKNRMWKMLGYKKGHENLKSPFAVFASETDGLSGLNSSAANGDSWLDSLHVVIQTHGYPARFIGLSVF
jgi:hypothetical protein